MPERPASPELEHFVRDVLGCSCPQEVFARIDESASERSRAAGVTHRIAVGGRLLIYVIRLAEIGGAEAVRPQMADWLAAGRAERDAAGMNRLRLVILTDDLEPAQEVMLRTAFGEANPEGDDRIHLHILDPSNFGDSILN